VLAYWGFNSSNDGSFEGNRGCYKEILFSKNKEAVGKKNSGRYHGRTLKEKKDQQERDIVHGLYSF